MSGLMPRSRSFLLVRILLVVMIAGYTAFFSIQLILHFHSFGSRALDLGNIGQAIWNTAQGNWFHQTNQPGATSRLSLHVEPILIPVSWLYWIYQSPEILFVFQSIVVALGAIPVFALARRALESEWLALIFALAYLLMPALQAATLLDFHPVTLAPTFLLAAFYFLETRRPFMFALFATLAVACKEDMTLLVMMMGLYALVINRQVRWGVITITLTAVWVFLAVFVIPRTFAGTENIHWNRYDHLGSSPVEILLNFFIQPQLFIGHLQSVNAIGYLRSLLAPTAYTALLNPVTLLLALPSLGINLFSNFPPMQRVNSLIYAAPIIPAVMISSIYGSRNVKRYVRRLSPRFPGAAPFVSKHATTALGLLILVASLTYHAYFGYFPGGGQFRGWEEVTDHHRAAADIFAQIPVEAKLSAQDRLNPHVSQRETLYIFDRVEDADHIVLDVTEDSWPLHPIQLRQRVDEYLNQGFGIRAANDGYLLLARNQPVLPSELPDDFFSFARAPNDFSPANKTRLVFENKLELLGFQLELGGHEKFLPVVTLYWRALQPLDKDYMLRPFFVSRSGEIIETPDERPLVTTLWYPTSKWQSGETILTSTLPFDLAPEVGDTFTLLVGVSTGDWSDRAQRLSIIESEPLVFTMEDSTWARLATFQRTGQRSYEQILPGSSTPELRLDVQFWDIITLTGVDLPATVVAPGGDIPFTLYWQSSLPITVDLTSFVHLRDESGNVIAQLDWGPQDQLGNLPTSAWHPGRPVVDSQSLSLPADLSPGNYALVAGWYYAPTGERLPVTTTGDAVTADNVALLGTVTVEN